VGRRRLESGRNIVGSLSGLSTRRSRGASSTPQPQDRRPRRSVPQKDEGRVRPDVRHAPTPSQVRRQAVRHRGAAERWLYEEDPGDPNASAHRRGCVWRTIEPVSPRANQPAA